MNYKLSLLLLCPFYFARLSCPYAQMPFAEIICLSNLSILSVSDEGSQKFFVRTKFDINFFFFIEFDFQMVIHTAWHLPIQFQVDPGYLKYT